MSARALPVRARRLPCFRGRVPLRCIAAPYFINHREYALTVPAHAPAIPHVRARRVTADPHTGRATERYVNAAHCRLAGGASVEAHLAAVAANALPEHMTQLDHLLRCGWKINTLKRVHASAHTRTHAQALPREAGLRARPLLFARARVWGPAEG